MAAAKLIAAMEFHKRDKLTHDFVDCDNRHKSGLIFTRTMESIIEPPKPLRTPKELLQQARVDQPADAEVTPTFKAFCLNTTIKFVKDDVQFTMQYPEMTKPQAEFLMWMLTQGKEGNTEQTELGYGYRTMYAPLWDSMRLFSLKYEFFINCVDLRHNRDNLKCIIFEKIPKLNLVLPEEMDVDVPNNKNIGSLGLSSPTGSRASPASYHSLSPEEQRNKSAEPRPLFIVKNKGKKKRWNKVKHNALARNVMHDIGSGELPEEFIRDCLRDMAEYLSSDADTSLEFTNVGVCEEYFVKNLQYLCRNTNAYVLFDGPGQIALGTIKHCLDIKGVAYSVTVVVKPKKNGLRDLLILKKQATTKTMEEILEKKLSLQIPPLSPTPDAPLTPQEKQTLIKYKEIKNNVEETYMHKTLQDISTFLSKENRKSITFDRVTIKQEEFIKHVHVWSKLDAVYDMFCSADRILLEDIKLKAKKYVLKVVVRDVQGIYTDEIVSDVTIVKNLREDTSSLPVEGKIVRKGVSRVKNSMNFKQLYLAYCNKMNEDDKKKLERARSLSVCPKETRSSRKKMRTLRASARARASRELLAAALRRPVRSDKALKMMQSMGWKGGALGLRGEGIVEPIMPAIDLAKGAGLGHVKPPPKPTPPKHVPKKGKAKKHAPPNPAPLKPASPKGNMKKSAPPKPAPPKLAPPKSAPPKLAPPKPAPPKLAPPKLAPPKGNAKKPNGATKIPPLRLLSTEFFPRGILPLEALAPNLIPREIIRTVPSGKDLNVYLNRSSYHHCVVQAISHLVTKDIRAVHFIYTPPDVPTTMNLQKCMYSNAINQFIRGLIKILDMKLPWPWPYSNPALKPYINNVQTLLRREPQLQLQGFFEDRTAVVYKIRTPDNTNSTVTTPQHNQSVPQANVRNLSGKYVIQVGTSSDGTSQFRNVFSKIGNYVPDKNTPICSIDLTDDELQHKTMHDAGVENTVENHVHKQTGINNADKDKRDVKDAEKVQIRTEKTTGNELNVDNSDKSNAKTDKAVLNDIETVNSPQIHVNHDNNQIVKKDVDKQISINNHEDYQNGIKAVKMVQKIDVRKDLITTTSDKTDDKTRDKNENEPIDYESDDYQVVLNTSGSTIEIGTDEEDMLLITDEETDQPAIKATDQNINVKLEKSQELENSKDIFNKGTVKIDKDLQMDEIAVKIENDLHINKMVVKAEEVEDSATLIQDNKTGKRCSVEFPDVDQTVKKSKLLADFKKLRILHKDYPQIKINRAKAREIQTSILNDIDYKTLPLLKCEGIQNGGLIYSCQDQKSLFFMEAIIKKNTDLKIVYEFDVTDKLFHKMAFKMNSFLEEDVGKVLKRLDLFNQGLNASNWEFIKKEQYADFVVICVELDNESFRYIYDANFTLYAGHDCAKFSVVWD